MARESKAMKSCVGFCCRGSGIRSELHQAAGTNENKGEGGKDKELRLLESL